MSTKHLTIIALVHTVFIFPNFPNLVNSNPGITAITPKPLGVGESDKTNGSESLPETTKLQSNLSSVQAAKPISVSSSNESSSNTMTSQIPYSLLSTLLPVSAALKSPSNFTTGTFQSQQPFLNVSPTPAASLSPRAVNETFQIFLNPPSINELRVNSNQTIIFNCTTTSGRSATTRQYDDNNNANTSATNNGSSLPPNHADSVQNAATNGNGSAPVTRRRYQAVIQTSNGKVAKLYKWDKNKKRRNFYDNSDYLYDKIRMHVRLNEEYNFTVEAMHIGYVTMSITLLDLDSEQTAKEGAYRALSHAKLAMTAIRPEKTADFVFDCSAAAVAILISFGIGCVTDTESLKRQLKYPMSILIGVCCQFLLMPVLAFGIAMMLPLELSIRFGLLCVACVPGGGLGHVAVVVSQADLPLSLAMNLLSIIVMLGTAPMWISVLGQYFGQKSISKVIYNFEIWLASTFFAYTAGLVINRFKPGMADALLTWIIKPFLLLATILYITLGVYINMYMFDDIKIYAVLAALLLPITAFAITFGLSKVFRQKPKFCQSAALETSSFNCLIVLAAIRFTLPKPDADLASEIPIWIMFTIPGMYVILSVIRVIKNFISNFLESRKQQQFRHFSIASGIVNQANMAALSAPLFVTEVTDDEQGSVSEKITVL
ncbi:uncharacterized protein LOC117326090 [Pecten maximus]|uniref:uncharacterized protein LOC117326090 n=1 Tax=Pecten maximus TaxID=6579 RepID=UPI001458C5D6|nr:uncharacterized protein LOC117326090 [Pecten maximus]XP_033738591.1 uncharacterized protein LOC117326090 [Pecten maximus]